MTQQQQQQALVTGANGFVASYLIKELLEAGYKVVGTVRSLKDPTKYEHLLSLPHAKENLKLVEADLLKEGGFDEAVKGSTVVFHTASPVILSTSNVQKDLLEPAVQGTRNVLLSAEKARDTVKRVVFTSSVVAIADHLNVTPGKVYTPDDWNTTSSETSNPYSYSKVLAEKEAWKITKELQEKYGKENTFDLAVIAPPVVIAPILAVNRIKSQGVKELNFSSSFIRNLFFTKKNPQGDGKISASFGLPIVDARDLARAHRLAFEVKEAGGKRFYVAGPEGTHQFYYSSLWLRDAYPEYADGLSNEYSGDLEEARKNLLHVDASKVQQILGLKDFISTKQTVLDTAKSLVDNDLINGIH